MGFDAQHRRVVSPMDRADLLALGRERYLPVYRPRELILERGQGARLWDSDGRDYVDFGAGIAVISRQALVHRQRVLQRAAAAAGR